MRKQQAHEGEEKASVSFDLLTKHVNRTQTTNKHTHTIARSVMETHFSANLSESLASNEFYVCLFFLVFIFLANDELLKAFGRSKDGNIRIIKASIEKGKRKSISANLCLSTFSNYYFFHFFSRHRATDTGGRD